jgi:hypothetical protein
MDRKEIWGESCGSGQGSSEYGNKPSDSIQQLSDSQGGLYSMELVEVNSFKLQECEL